MGLRAMDSLEMFGESRLEDLEESEVEEADIEALARTDVFRVWVWVPRHKSSRS